MRGTVLDEQLARRLRQLGAVELRGVLGSSLRGIERETLRVDAQGRLVHTPHPRGLGSALTHPQITTDYSEALLEFITPAVNSVDAVLQELSDIHREVVPVLKGQGERLWMQSMPAALPGEDDIPIAWYGSSHIGMLKHVYRRGLAVRYGRRMQCIAGVHYNHSLAPQVWTELGVDPSAGYLGLIRNFRRHSWLLMLLFGASPVVSSCFLCGRDHGLDTLSNDTLYLPWATSLRMSDLGYQNDAQAQLRVPCDDLDGYVRTLSEAVHRPHPAYERIGTHRDGEWIQMSTHVLQIENEYYATIRPKRVTLRGESPLEALVKRGIQYVEVRCLDVDPFEPLGIHGDTARMTEIYLWYCALMDSPLCTESSLKEQRENYVAVVNEGRRPGLTLRRGGQALLLTDWAEELLERMQPVAEFLDGVLDAGGGGRYVAALAAQRAKVADLESTPSARVLAGVKASGGSFHRWAQELSTHHAQQLLAHPLPDAVHARFVQQAEASLAEQAALEAGDRGTSFDDFLHDYLDRIPRPVPAME